MGIIIMLIASMPYHGARGLEIKTVGSAVQCP